MDIFVGSKHVLNIIIIYKQSVIIPRTRPLANTNTILIDNVFAPNYSRVHGQIWRELGVTINFKRLHNQNVYSL